MIGPLDLILAFVLDLAIGDPRWLPHPVRAMGRGITKAEGFLRRHFGTPEEERWGGVLLVAMIVIPAFAITFVLHRIILWISRDVLVIAGMAAIVYLIATTIALRGLIDSARLVIESAKDGCLAAARKKLAMIVGRDTEELSEEGVLKATIETLAENLSDGFVAPTFYLVVGGLPLAMAYKAINTLDSMVGYRNDRYRHLGWASARLDDIANFIPARITALFIAAASTLFLRSADRGRESLRIMRRDGRNHPSPNSGVPEAAMAGGLGVRLGGPSTYGGVLVEKPFIGEAEGNYLKAAERAVSITKGGALLAVFFAVIVLSLRAWS